jgi:predicted enzyme related to lactoylglutathione lyase
MTLARTPPVTFNHIGLTVPNLEEAVAWYETVFNMQVVAGPLVVDAQGPLGDMAVDMLGQRFRSCRVAHMMTSNGIGVEFFEFTDPPTEISGEVQSWKSGLSHFCVTWPDVGEMAAHITAHGGKQRSKVWPLFDSCDVAYCEDPFGNIVEIFSNSYTYVFSRSV